MQWKCSDIQLYIIGGSCIKSSYAEFYQIKLDPASEHVQKDQNTKTHQNKYSQYAVSRFYYVSGLEYQKKKEGI